MTCGVKTFVIGAKPKEPKSQQNTQRAGPSSDGFDKGKILFHNIHLLSKVQIKARTGWCAK